jgi:hypothetical protein
MTMIGSIERQHRELLRSLERLEALVRARGSCEELAHAIEDVRREMLAHELTAERFIVGPLCRLHHLDANVARELRAELDDLAADALRLVTDDPGRRAIEDFVGAARRHIEHQARRIVPAAQDALARGELPAAPAWCVDEAFGPGGGPAVSWPEQWLG